MLVSSRSFPGLPSFVAVYLALYLVGLASNVSIQQDGNTIIISFPQVEMLDVSVSYPDDESIIRTSSGLFYADVSSEDITQAMMTAPIPPSTMTAPA